jgi:redox-sensitive bicupin YhaK (pirin superfamily)
MFDYGAPKMYKPTTTRKGVGQHPHRGIETVTIAFQGEVEHADSMGNTGVIGPGDVQWMTAGRGIIHEEYHSKALAKSGGMLEMCQIWVNLPAASKMVAPRYQPILAGDIPVVDLRAACGANGTLRIIAGSCLGATGPALTHSPIELWDVRLEADSPAATLPLAEGHAAIVFVRTGDATIGGSAVGPQGVALMSSEGGSLVIAPAKGARCDILVLAGAPINEPIAARGPFVMNTQAELRQAMMDYQMGNFGT